MKAFVSVFVLIVAAACGDNIEPEVDEPAALIACDDTLACDQALEASLEGWLASGADQTYQYTTRFEAGSGYRIDTEVVLEGGQPVARHASGLRPDDATDALVAFNWSETAEQLGIHSEGARPVPISTLYEECVLEVLSVDRVANEVTLELFDSGTLRSCTFKPRGCSGDCAVGPRIDSIQLATE